MFKFEEICELIKLVGSTEVASVEIEHGGTKLRIEGPQRTTIAHMPDSGAAVVTAPVAQVVQEVQPAAASGGAKAATEAQEEEEGLHFVTSPIVGTFYRAPSPESDPYVKVGDFVEKGQVLCIVEAMKLMNEIEADASGTITKVYPQNAEPVEFGQRLFAIRPA